MDQDYYIDNWEEISTYPNGRICDDVYSSICKWYYLPIHIYDEIILLANQIGKDIEEKSLEISEFMTKNFEDIIEQIKSKKLNGCFIDDTGKRLYIFNGKTGLSEEEYQTKLLSSK